MISIINKNKHDLCFALAVAKSIFASFFSLYSQHCNKFSGVFGGAKSSATSVYTNDSVTELQAEFQLGSRLLHVAYGAVN